MIHQPESFAQLIETQMQALGINQVELERRSGITDTSWASWRAGALPKIRAFFPLIAQTLAVPLELVQSIVERDRVRRGKPVRIDTVEETQAWIAKQEGGSHAGEPTPGGVA